MTLVVAGVAVDSLTRPTRVLACRRSRPVELAGRWEFPGGKVEAAERPEDALVRELREELSVGCVVGDELASPAGGWPIRAGLSMRAWLVRLDGDPTVGESHDACRWLGSSELDAVAWLPVDLDVVAAFRHTLTDGALGMRHG